MARQAGVSSDEYEPMVPMQDLPCCPSELLWDRLKDGWAPKAASGNFEDESKPVQDAPFRLQRGRDFDDVVLGISRSSLPGLNRRLLSRQAALKVSSAGDHHTQLLRHLVQGGIRPR